MEARRLADALAFNPEKLAKHALFDSPHLFYDLYCLKPGQGQKVHAHEGSDKIYYVVEGEGIFTVGDTEALHGAGVAVLAREGQPHGVRNEGPADLVALVVMAPRPA